MIDPTDEILSDEWRERERLAREAVESVVRGPLSVVQRPTPSSTTTARPEPVEGQSRAQKIKAFTASVHARHKQDVDRQHAAREARTKPASPPPPSEPPVSISAYGVPEEPNKGVNGGEIQALRRLVEGMRRQLGQQDALIKRLYEQLPAYPVPSGGGGGDVQLIKITGNASGGGWYSGNIWTPAGGSLNPSTSLTETQLGSAGASVYFAHTNEQATTNHDLTNVANTKQFLFIGLYWGTTSGGTKCYVGDGTWLEDCT